MGGVSCEEEVFEGYNGCLCQGMFSANYSNIGQYLNHSVNSIPINIG